MENTHTTFALFKEKNVSLDKALDHYIVCIGASAGGMEAIHQLFDCIPHDTGFSFIVIQHLSSDHKSLMAELLSAHTEMKVVEAKDNTPVAPNSVYVIPNDSNITIRNRTLLLRGKEKGRSFNMAIDIFLNSLADDIGDKAIAIILSGTGTDGTAGIAAIKKAGGLVFVQDPATAKFNGMPLSAIASGNLDFILSPESIAEELLMQHNVTPAGIIVDSLPAEDEPVLLEIFSFIQSKTRHDFNFYKRPTLIRRLTRRMAFLNCKHLKDYFRLLNESPDEVNLLCKEFLIGVTRFFRDAEAFEELKLKVIPEIIKDKSNSDTIKVWVAGCSTGEEVYSIAILIKEHLSRLNADPEVKIFASDVNRESLDFASKGCYSEAVAKDIPGEFLEKYFVKDGNKFKVLPRLRKSVVFSHHDLLKDPPFGRLDLICCRNILIYISPELQKRIMAIFNFSLNLGGFLFLGPSENIRELKDTMVEISKKWKIYKKSQVTRSIGLEAIPYSDSVSKKSSPVSFSLKREVSRRAVAEMVLNKIMSEYTMAGVLVDKYCNIIETFGDYRKYLQLPEKKFDYNLLKMLSPKASIVVSSSFRKSIAGNEKYEVRNLKINEQHTATVTVMPFHDNLGSQVALVLFNDAGENAAVQPLTSAAATAEHEISPEFSDFLTLQHELRETREILQKAIEDSEITNEELQSANEELISSNEELQSTNEELQSLNEELHTVNAENQLRIKQVSELNDDLNNYFASTDIGQVFLDKNLLIRKYTPQVRSIINLIESDIGRPISHISNNIYPKDLVADIQQVIQTKQTLIKTIKVDSKGWYQMKILPYLREGNVIDGAVLTFVDITAIKIAEEKLRKANKELNDLNENLLRSNKELEQFAYITSHDLQEPLRKIQTFVELIGKKPSDQIALKKYLDKISLCSSRMSLLIHDVLSYSRLIKGDERFVEADLNEILKTVLSDFELLIEEKKATIKNSGLPVVKGVPLQLQQLFSNLISNSIKFCEERPVIEISSEKVPDEEAGKMKELNEEYQYIKLIFKDNGIGFDEQYTDKMFTIFQRLNHRNIYSGSGIGLALCKRIAENHQGAISASSTLGCGATFEVYLPWRHR